MIKENYELSSTTDNGRGASTQFSVSLKTLSQKKMRLTVCRDGDEQAIDLQNGEIFVLLKLLRMPAMNQVNNGGEKGRGGE